MRKFGFMRKVRTIFISSAVALTFVIILVSVILESGRRSQNSINNANHAKFLANQAELARQLANENAEQRIRDLSYQKEIEAQDNMQAKILKDLLAQKSEKKDLTKLYKNSGSCFVGERDKFGRTANDEDFQSCAVDNTIGTLGFNSCVNKRRSSDATESATTACNAAFGE